MQFSEALLDRLASAHGYTHCFFVAGGNTMHLLNAARSRFICIPVVHEVSAGIAAEYFNATNLDNKKGFALVTAGPGLTNIVTSIAGAYLESRNLLVIGGQVKTIDMKSSTMRQNGIQEIDGVSIVQSIANKAARILKPITSADLDSLLQQPGREGPVFLEIPLDVQAATVSESPKNLKIQTINVNKFKNREAETLFVNSIIEALKESNRPIILLGGGVSNKTSRILNLALNNLGIPIMTTWNGISHYASDQENYWGRPNTWGQRSSNLLIQQCDLLIAIGTRLGLQQTGFAWAEFAPIGKIFQIEIDKSEIEKGHPKISNSLVSDANSFLHSFVDEVSTLKFNFRDWIEFGASIIKKFPLSESSNVTSEGYINPYDFILTLSELLSNETNIIPASSGGAFTVSMQALKTKQGQLVISNKGLASMGYGLAGAIGAYASNHRPTILIEGDGGFAQNLQELGTVARQNSNIKIFIFSNRGYASILMTQRNYFNGAYIGCDETTGLGLPNWELLASAFGIPYFKLTARNFNQESIREILEKTGPFLIEVDIDPEQTYWPKINSKILPNGQMVSNPLHKMSPPLEEELEHQVLPYFFDRLE